MSKRDLESVARKFQRDMQKLGLGVTFEVPGRPPVAVTTWCEGCDHVAVGASAVCPNCGADLAEGKSADSSRGGER